MKTALITGVTGQDGAYLARLLLQKGYTVHGVEQCSSLFNTPEYTANTDAIGTLRLLEALPILGMTERTRFYQASTSELYGNAPTVPQNEMTPFYPRSPYRVAKLYAYWITVTYREAYGLYASNGVGYDGPVVWDVTKPDGTPRKLIDSSRLWALGWSPSIALREGIQGTYVWFQSHSSH